MKKPTAIFKIEYKKIIDLVLFIVFVLVSLYNTLTQALVNFFPAYRITKPLLIAIIFLYVCVWLFATQKNSDSIILAKHSLLLISIFLVVIIPAILFIILRLNSAPYKFVHDGVVQNESATKFFLEGKNPYVENYLNTPLKDFPYPPGIHAAFDYYSYLPFTFIFPLTIQIWLEPILGWFDHRIVYLLCFILVIGLIFRLIKNNDDRSIAVSIIGLNPFFVYFIIQGRNDILVLLWIILSILCLQKNRLTLSTFFLAIGCATKPFAWFLVPFFLLYLFGNGSWKEMKLFIFKSIIVFACVLGILVLPWIIADSKAFLGDVIGFQSGMNAENCAISGMGFSMLLLKLRLLSNSLADFPFFIVQLSLSLLAIPVLLYQQIRSNTLKRMLLNYSILTGIVFFFARAFLGNYLGYLMIIFCISFMVRDESKPILVADEADDGRN
ncbi:MAG: DUF2029 domain-containing protein [Chloroflexi bacterium]|nr:DUF2029 domain-containing protein [Chloroflexota bacterium]